MHLQKSAQMWTLLAQAPVEVCKAGCAVALEAGGCLNESALCNNLMVLFSEAFGSADSS